MFQPPHVDRLAKFDTGIGANDRYVPLNGDHLRREEHHRPNHDLSSNSMSRN